MSTAVYGMCTACVSSVAKMTNSTPLTIAGNAPTTIAAIAAHRWTMAKDSTGIAAIAPTFSNHTNTGMGLGSSGTRP